MKKALLTFAVILLANVCHSQNTYALDKYHSKLGFSVMHFGISNVEGRFKSFDATMKSSKEDFSDAVIEMAADAASIDTDVEMRDKDLRSDNWLDAEKYPKLVFKSSSFKKVSDKMYKLEGNMTIHGVTKPMVFNVVYNGKAQNPASKKNSVGFTVTGKLNRKDFNIGTGPSAGAVGNEVELRSNVEFIMQ
jgi:polyisoprenoid-binding protein YceI